MSKNHNKNEKIGKWSLYGTFIGIFIIGTIYSISSEGIVSTLTDFYSFIFSVVAIVIGCSLILYVVNLISEKLVPIASLVLLVVSIHFMERSWLFIVFVAIMFSLFYLVEIKVKNERLAKKIYVILGTIVLLIWSFH